MIGTGPWLEGATVCDKGVAPRDAPDAEARCQRASTRTAGPSVAYLVVVRRRLLIAAVFLLAGAVVNVAVAWGCAFWSRVNFRERPLPGLTQIDAPCWSYQIRKRIGTLSVAAAVLSGDTRYDQSVSQGARYVRTELPSWSMLLEPPPPIDHRSGGMNLYQQANGYPLLAFTGATRYTVTWSPRTLRVDSLDCYELRSLPRPILLPFRPIWSGFTVNTIFYAAILWLLIPGPFVLRRFIRVRRSLCPACAYPMGESAVCSECGRGLPGGT